MYTQSLMVYYNGIAKVCAAVYDDTTGRNFEIWSTQVLILYLAGTSCINF